MYQHQVVIPGSLHRPQPIENGMLPFGTAGHYAPDFCESVPLHHLFTAIGDLLLRDDQVNIIDEEGILEDRQGMGHDRLIVQEQVLLVDPAPILFPIPAAGISAITLICPCSSRQITA